ncbi:serine/threonine-protein kinase Nek [Novymonas esmeraldas]|uniref:non-specific serine/threonine protein kinase n=1 Tax=Novymonas esmeraldas TaxID=1808958 RepID=A0AAW0F301_9TRYP
MSSETAAAEQRMRDYEVFEHLGSGATSDVYRVVNRTNSRTYVLKKMSLANMSDEEKLRAKQEIIVMDNVDHPNVVKFRESFSDPVDNSVDIVMEHCEFGTLEDLIERQRYEGHPFPTDVLLEWMAELLCGLSHIHSNRILHRDLKTSNIFVTSKNHLKLGDFGVCKILSNPNAKAESMIGTPLYFAPEVCNNDAYDERSDVWSLGIVFYEMCTLRRPFEADNLFSLIQLILESDIAPFGNGVDGSLEGLVLQMLDRDPSRRPTAQVLIDVHLEVPVSHPSHPSQKPSNGRLLQQYSGPQLEYAKKWPPPPSTAAGTAAGTAARKDGRARAPTEWVHTGGALDVLAGFQRATHGVPAAAKVKGDVGAAPSSKPPPATSSGGATKAKAERATKRATSSTKPTTASSSSSASSSRTRRKPAAEHVAAGKKDNAASGSLSSFTMRELQLDVQRRRSAMFGDDGSATTDDVPVVIDLHGGSFVEAWSASRGSRGTVDAHGASTGGEAATPKDVASFAADVAAALDRHTSNGRQIDLEVLDEAVCLLAQYKYLNYGLR